MPTLAEVLERVLISTEYDDMTGPVTISVTDALLQIAAAINRLASSHEAMTAKGDRISDQLRAAMKDRLFPEDGPGHA